VSARGKARRKALDILFEADVRKAPVPDALADFEKRRLSAKQPPLNPFTVALVEGVVDHWDHINQIIAENSIGWTLDRMPRVDRNVLRLGIFELLWRDDIPDKVAVAEAVEITVELSTDESPPFVNGLLGQILRDKPTLSGTPAVKAAQSEIEEAGKAVSADEAGQSLADPDGEPSSNPDSGKLPLATGDQN
jgi:N utilization substance protein B